MNNSPYTTPPRMFFLSMTALLAMSLLVSAGTLVSEAIEDIRMCAVEQRTDRCPTDNPVFENGAGSISINVRSSALRQGDEVRFTWYRLDDSEFFSTYLGTVYEQVGTADLDEGVAVVQSLYPGDTQVEPGNYEVLVHTPNSERPVIKYFKVLD